MHYIFFDNLKSAYVIQQFLYERQARAIESSSLSLIGGFMRLDDALEYLTYVCAC